MAMVAVDAIFHHVVRSESVCAAFLDLCKAFDSLNHCILLHQLLNLGYALPYYDGFVIIYLIGPEIQP